MCSRVRLSLLVFVWLCPTCPSMSLSLFPSVPSNRLSLPVRPTVPMALSLSPVRLSPLCLFHVPLSIPLHPPLSVTTCAHPSLLSCARTSLSIHPHPSVPACPRQSVRPAVSPALSPWQVGAGAAGGGPVPAQPPQLGPPGRPVLDHGDTAALRPPPLSVRLSGRQVVRGSVRESVHPWVRPSVRQSMGLSMGLSVTQ